MRIEKSEVWVTGIGLVSSLGEGPDTHWAELASGRVPVPSIDHACQAPYPVHPMVEFNVDAQIPKRSDQRQMEPWQRLGTYAAGLALNDAGIAHQPELLAETNMIIAAGGGERDLEVDAAIMAKPTAWRTLRPVLNAALNTELRPPCFSRNFQPYGRQHLAGAWRGRFLPYLHGRGTAGVRRRRRCANPARPDKAHSGRRRLQRERAGTSYMLFRLGTPLSKRRFVRSGTVGPNGALALAAMGAFVVLESRAHAEKRGATTGRASCQVRIQSQSPPEGAARAAASLLRTNRKSGREPCTRACAVVISGASGVNPDRRGHQALDTGSASRSAPRYLIPVNGMEAQFLANIAIGCQAVARERYFRIRQRRYRRRARRRHRQAVVTNFGHWRGEGFKR